MTKPAYSILPRRIEGFGRSALSPKIRHLGKLVIKVGENGLKADVEGLTIYSLDNGEGYLIASSQGNSTFKVYERSSNHTFVGTFVVKHAKATDGIDVTNVNLNPHFTKGLFACHSGADRPYPVLLTSWNAFGNVFGNFNGKAGP